MKPESMPIVPWYKQRWPWILMSIPFSSICVGSYFMYQAIEHADPMVQEQYYAAGQSINKVIAAGREAARLGLAGRLDFDGDKVTLDLSQRVAEPLPPVLTLQLSHPTIAKLDQTVTLVQGSAGRYSGTMHPTDARRWDITLAAPDKSWSLSGSWRSDLGAAAKLTPTDVREAAN